jgi:membrane protein YdbS with pleckstrin-like domain
MVVGIGLMVAALAMPFSRWVTLSMVSAEIPSTWGLIGSTIVGFTGFWLFLLNAVHGIFATTLTIDPHRVKFKTGLLLDQEPLPTKRIEEVLVHEGPLFKRVLIVADEGAIAYTINAMMSRKQADRIADWIRWAVQEAAGPR